VNGLRLRCVDWGGSSPQFIVFLHGGGTTARTWDLVCLALRDRFHCLALDLRGHGDSDWSADADYSLADYAADVTAIVRRLVPGAPIIVGNSLGGQAGLLAIGGGAPAKGLILVDVGPEPARAGTDRIVNSLRTPQEFPDLDAVVRTALSMNPRRDANVLRESLLHNLRRLPDGNWTWKYDWRAFAGLTRETLARRTAALWQAAAQVQCPVLVIRGAHSEILSEHQVDELCARITGRCEHRTVADAGHTVHGDNPGGFIAAVEPFLCCCCASHPDE
jgi:pimeloyl-ACP methyl ester carboxylesterase